MKNPWKLFVMELVFFLATLLMGVGVATRVGRVINYAYAGTDNFSGEISPLFFISYFFVATAIIFLISKNERFKKGKIAFFNMAFIFSTAIGSMISLSVFLGDLLAFLITIFLLILWKYKPFIFLHNLLVVLSIAGIGAIIGAMFDPVTIVLFLVLFSVYDFIAVYKTKHMVKMATEMIKTKAIMGLVIPLSFKGLLDDLEKKKKKEFMVLGGGDLAFPLFLVVSVTLNIGLSEGLLMIFFSSLGLFGSFFLFITQKTKKPIPALPPISVSCIVGLIIIALT